MQGLPFTLITQACMYTCTSNCRLHLQSGAAGGRAKRAPLLVTSIIAAVLIRITLSCIQKDTNMLLMLVRFNCRVHKQDTVVTGTINIVTMLLYHQSKRGVHVHPPAPPLPTGLLIVICANYCAV